MLGPAAARTAVLVKQPPSRLHLSAGQQVSWACDCKVDGSVCSPDAPCWGRAHPRPVAGTAAPATPGPLLKATPLLNKLLHDPQAPWTKSSCRAARAPRPARGMTVAASAAPRRAPGQAADLAVEECEYIFGFGSLITHPGFDYSERVQPCYIRGWRRVFHQGSTDHRGVPEAPGRTVTLERCEGAVTVGGVRLAWPTQLQRSPAMRHSSPVRRRCSGAPPSGWRATRSSGGAPGSIWSGGGWGRVIGCASVLPHCPWL